MCRCGASPALCVLTELQPLRMTMTETPHDHYFPPAHFPDYFLLGDRTLSQSSQLLMNEKNRTMASDVGQLLKPSSLMVRWVGSGVPQTWTPILTLPCK